MPDLRVKRAGLGARISALARSFVGISDLRVKRAGLGARISALARSFVGISDLRVKRAGLGARSSALIRSVLRKVLRVKRAGLGARSSALIRTVSLFTFSPFHFLFLGLHFSLFTFLDHFSIFTCVKRLVFLYMPDLRKVLRVKRAGLGARSSALIRTVSLFTFSPFHFLILGLHFSLFTFLDHFSIFTCVKRLVFLYMPDLRVKRAGLSARISALTRFVRSWLVWLFLVCMYGKDTLFTFSPFHFLILGLHFSLFTFLDHFSIFTFLSLIEMWGVLWKNWYVLSCLGTGWGKVWSTMGRLYLYRMLKVRMRMILGMWMLNRMLLIWWALFEEWSRANLEEKLVNLVCFEIEGCECGLNLRWVWYWGWKWVRRGAIFMWKGGVCWIQVGLWDCEKWEKKVIYVKDRYRCWWEVRRINKGPICVYKWIRIVTRIWKKDRLKGMGGKWDGIVQDRVRRSMGGWTGERWFNKVERLTVVDMMRGIELYKGKFEIKGVVLSKQALRNMWVGLEGEVRREKKKVTWLVVIGAMGHWELMELEADWDNIEEIVCGHKWVVMNSYGFDGSDLTSKIIIAWMKDLKYNYRVINMSVQEKVDVYTCGYHVLRWIRNYRGSLFTQAMKEIEKGKYESPSLLTVAWIKQVYEDFGYVIGKRKDNKEMWSLKKREAKRMPQWRRERARGFVLEKELRREQRLLKESLPDEIKLINKEEINRNKGKLKKKWTWEVCSNNIGGNMLGKLGEIGEWLEEGEESNRMVMMLQETGVSSETWEKNSVKGLCRSRLPEYEILHNGGRGVNTAGVGILVHNNMRGMVERDKIIRDDEGRFIAVPWRVEEKVKWWFVSVYAPSERMFMCKGERKPKEFFYQQTLRSLMGVLGR